MWSLNPRQIYGPLRIGVAALTLCAQPAVVLAQQAPACHVPDPMPVPPLVAIPRGEVVRSSDIGGYILALSWSPQYCATVRDPDSVRNRDQCAVPRQTAFWKTAETARAPYAWILHGLWPQSINGPHPQWCRSTRIVPKDILRRNFCTSPSVYLMQRQWAKHGSCMTDKPATYFQLGTDLFHKMRFPDMRALSRGVQNSASIRQAFSQRNTGTRDDMFTVHTDREGWLREVRLCLNASMRPTSCGPNQLGLMGPRRIFVRPVGN